MEKRHSEILALLKDNGKVMVDELSRHFNVSVQTVRKDLSELEQQCLLTRMHGGAIASSSIENLGYKARQAIKRKEKAAIGEAAANLIADGASLFINLGTTTEACAAALKSRKNLLVITNNINVATLLHPNPELEVVIAGGVVRPSDGGVVGVAAVDFISQFRVDYAVIGVSAIDKDGALMDFDIREVKVAQTIIANARHVVLVADGDKFKRHAPVKIGHISQVDTFITEYCSAPIRRICRDNNVHVIETKAK